MILCNYTLKLVQHFSISHLVHCLMILVSSFYSSCAQSCMIYVKRIIFFSNLQNALIELLTQLQVLRKHCYQGLFFFLASIHDQIYWNWIEALANFSTMGVVQPYEKLHLVNNINLMLILEQGKLDMFSGIQSVLFTVEYSPGGTIHQLACTVQ